ncbi:type II secretion system F family protein [Micavibrio aeruginosavorus]|uniref:Bacterial type II secretion system F domain protein n=1 Tax=Micavibrio aeruginosavorus (strain ARL-13) TaxID=856793 RepID=G2KPP2_MICAA|nr:type II secretion system F family protein [Micavibrio aeruginosavorus]AEP09861.1 bacterial type II secretion system F domain protein [Micavibrio aeruginosavorus ARL-13]
MAADRYKYRAINNKGRPVRGVISAANEVDLYNQLQSAGLELIQCQSLTKKKGMLSDLRAPKISTRDLIQLFMHMEQMQGAGVALLDALADIRDTTEHDRLRDVLSEVHRDVSDGSALSEAMGHHPKTFGSLYISLIAAGEETGDLTAAYRHLIKYLKWVDQMQAKVRKATRYPTILVVVVIATIVVMMSFVVPQIVGFIRNLDQELPWYTTSLMATSDFFVKYWWGVLATPPILFVVYKALVKSSEDFAYRMDRLFLEMPVAGPLIRKINIARFAQTFGAMFASGIDVLSALRAARNTVKNLALVEALEGVEEQVAAGSPLSEAFNASGEFPSMVVRMLKVGEESGNLTVVLDQVAEFYTNDVDEAVQGLIAMIEPFLTMFLGVMIMWIAVAVFGPIYASFENIDF